MKTRALFIVVAFWTCASADPSPRMQKIMEENRKTSAVADARSLDILHQQAKKWFFTPRLKNYQRIPWGMDGVTYYLPLEEIIRDGFLPGGWNNRHGNGPATVLNHPYIVTVMRVADPNGQSVTTYYPDEKFRFDFMTTLGEPGSIPPLPPRAQKIPVVIKFQRRHAVTGEGPVDASEWLNTDFIRLGSLNFPLENGTVPDVVSEITNTAKTAFTGQWDAFVDALYSRNGSQAMPDHTVAWLKSITTSYTPFMTDFRLWSCRLASDEGFSDPRAWLRENLTTDVDDSYEVVDVLMCSGAIRTGTQTNCRYSYCSGGSLQTDTTYFLAVSNVQSEWLSGAISQCQTAYPTASGWSCNTNQMHLITCITGPSDCTGSTPPEPVPPSGGIKCEVWKWRNSDDENLIGFSRNANFVYPAPCAGDMVDPATGQVVPVMQKAMEDTKGVCELHPSDPEKATCRELCSIFLDQAFDGVKDDPNPLETVNYKNCTLTSRGHEDGKRLYNEDSSNPNKLEECRPAPENAPLDLSVEWNIHEAPCKFFAAQTLEPPQYVIAGETFWLARGGPLGSCTPGDYCEPAEWIDDLCRVVIENWDKGWSEYPVKAGSQGECVQVGTEPGQTPGWLCTRSIRQSTRWLGSGYEPFTPPPDAIDRPCIQGFTRQVPWIKQPHFGTAQ